MKSTREQSRHVFTAGFIACVGIVTALVLWFAIESSQQRPPRLRATNVLADSPGDREAIEAIAALKRVSVVIQPERLALTTEGGAEALELFRVAGESRANRLFLHTSPVVRGYAAFHLLQATPDEAKRLQPLLSDESPVTVAAYDDVPEPRTVAEFVVDMMCAKRANEKVRAVLDGAAHNWRLLAIRDRALHCAALHQPQSM